MSRNRMSWLAAEVLANVGVEGTAHELRHTFATKIGPGCDVSHSGVMYWPVQASGTTLERPAAVPGELAWLQGTRGRALAARKRRVGLGEHHRLLEAVPREGRRCEKRGKGEA
jgi:hypothetical protein